MPRRLRTYLIAEGVSYSHHPHHRNGHNQKSQWTIQELEERSVFENALHEGWGSQFCLWGLHRPDNIIEYLGSSASVCGHRDLFVAKFVNKNGQNSWHGYPADHQRTKYDIPDTQVLNTWMQSGLLSAPKIRKIMSQQPCSL